MDQHFSGMTHADLVHLLSLALRYATLTDASYALGVRELVGRNLFYLSAREREDLLAIISSADPTVWAPLLRRLQGTTMNNTLDVIEQVRTLLEQVKQAYARQQRTLLVGLVEAMIGLANLILDETLREEMKERK